MVATIVWAASWTKLGAQRSPTRPEPGQRVRLHLIPPAGTMDGTVLGWTADTLVLGPLNPQRSLPDTLMRVPRSSIVGYQPSLGRDRGAGAVRGAVVGGALGSSVGIAIVIVSIVGSLGGDCEQCTSGLVAGAAVGATVAAIGAMIGAVIGPLLAPDRWGDGQEVSLRERPGRPSGLALRHSPAR